MKNFILLSIFAFMVVSAPLYAEKLANKTPDDVYQQVMQLKQQVVLLRNAADITIPWPSVKKIADLTPRHVLQKSIEVLDKIKRLRRIHKMGPITVPLFPTRDITPNEVYDMTNRLIEEFKLFPGLKNATFEFEPKHMESGRTPSDVYQELWTVSLAINPLLGVRGLKPSDVYIQSLKILEQIKFLRISQSLPLNIPPPLMTEGKRPNHTLAQAYKLLEKTAQAEHNLWIDPIKVPSVPRKEITPSEVYDALLIIQAELERLKYRLGVERDIIIPSQNGRKTPDDVLFNLAWSTAMMPQFENSTPIRQYPQQSLNKNANHLYALSEHIIRELFEYRKLRGIQTVPREVPTQANLQAHHIYQKTQHVMHKISRIREQEGLGALAQVQNQLREISLTEVYDLIIRLDAELQILYERIDMPAQLAEQDHSRFYTDKNESDVFQQMWTISYMLDAILGNEGYTPTDVFKRAQHVVEEIKIIGQAMNRPMIDLSLPTLIHGKQPADVLEQSQFLGKILKTLKLRMGLLGQEYPMSPTPNQVTPDDVHNGIELIASELERIKIYLGITQTVKVKPHSDNEEKTPSQVFQQLQLAIRLLQSFIE